MQSEMVLNISGCLTTTRDQLLKRSPRLSQKLWLVIALEPWLQFVTWQIHRLELKPGEALALISGSAMAGIQPNLATTHGSTRSTAPAFFSQLQQ